MIYKLRSKMKGFTLIELMIVVAIIGIMAAIAIPNFLNYMCKSRQSEAKTGLGAIRTGEESYFAEFSSYTSVQAAIGFGMKTGGRYSFLILPMGTATGYTAIASGIPRDNTDVWRIYATTDTKGDLTNTTMGCN